jgi:tripartite-type tricarboxylate transporter receptor subunit TctC
MAAALGLAAGAANAQDAFPNKPIRMIIPFAPGGATDLAGRAVADRLSQLLGQPIVIENRVGAGGQVGTAAVAKSPADGYTWLFGASSVMLILPALEQNVQFDTLKEFSVVARTSRLPLIIAVPASLGIKDLNGLRAYMKADPGKISYGSAGNGTTSHVGAAAFAQINGTPQAVHVPYKGTAPAIVDLVAGRLTYIMDAIGPLQEQIKAGKLVAIANTDKERAPQLPDLPTALEAGMPEFAKYPWTAWSGIFVPKGTPQPIIDRINREANRALKEPEVIKKLVDLGFGTLYGSAAEAQQIVNQEFAMWPPLIKSLGIKP